MKDFLKNVGTIVVSMFLYYFIIAPIFGLFIYLLIGMLSGGSGASYHTNLKCGQGTNYVAK